MGAYEGVRGGAHDQPDSSRCPTALMRQGDFSRDHHRRSGTRSPAAVPGQHHSAVACCRRVASKLLQYYPRPNRAGHGQQLPGAGANTRQHRPGPGPRRSEHRQQDPRCHVRYNWHDSFDAASARSARPRASPAARQQEHAGLVHAHAAAEPAQRLPDRLPPHRLRHAEPLHGRRHTDGRVRPRHSRLRRRRQVQQSRHPEHQHQRLQRAWATAARTGTSSTRRSRCRTCWRGPRARTTSAPASTCGGWRRAGGRRTIPRGRFNFTGDMTGYSVADFMLGLPRTVITPADQIQGHVGGWRNGFFVNDVWQATRNLTLSLGLRYELQHARADLRGLRVDARRGLQTRSSRRTLPAPWASSSTSRTTRTSRRVSARPIASARRPWCAPASGIYYNPNQMNSFTFLTNNPPLAAEFTFNNDPANPTLSFDQPIGAVGPGGPPEHDLAQRATCQRAQESVELRHPARALRRPRRSSSSTSARTRRTWIAASSTTRRSRVPAPSIRGGRARRSGRCRIIQNDLIADYDAVSIILRQPHEPRACRPNAHYTWSRTRDMATHSNGGGQTMNNYDIWSDYGPANWDIPHRFVVSYIYDMPFFRTRRQPVPASTSSAAGRSAASRRSRAARRSTSRSSPIARTSASATSARISSAPTSS